MTGYEALRERIAWMDLSSRGKLRVTGEDRARLLHAMSTNNVKDSAEGEGLYALFLNDKGRILADACIYNFGDHFLLDTEPEIVDGLREHLERYIIADDVALEDETKRWATLGLEGPKSVEVASISGIPVPETPNGTKKWENGFVARVASTGPQGLRVFVPIDEKITLLERLHTLGIPAANAAEARIVRLENGIPRYGEDITDRYLVQEARATRAVHFSKGCYLGQEIVERVRSRGQVHRLLTPIRVEAAEAPASGTKLIADGKEIAEITSAVYSPGLGEVVGLAYVRAEIASEKPEMTIAGTDPQISAYIR